MILAVLLTRELSLPMGVDSHHDFLAFLAAGRLVIAGRPFDLYDAAAITAIQRAIVPDPIGMNGYMPFINPPFAAVAFAPIAALPEQAGRVLWAALSTAMLVTAAILIARPLQGRRRVTMVLLIVLSYPAYHALAEGQWSTLMLLGGVIALRAARTGSWRVAGLALAGWWLKPQLILLPLVALALAGRWAAVRWMLLGGVALGLLSLPFVGFDTYTTYVRYLLVVATSHFNGAGAVAPSVWQGDLGSTEGLNGLLVGIAGQRAVTAVNLVWVGLSLWFMGLWLQAARRRTPGFSTPDGRRILAAGIGIVLLVNPNLFRQDCLLVFLLIPALCADAADACWRMGVGVAAIAGLTLVDQVSGAHLFTLALLVVVLILLRLRPSRLPLPRAPATSGLA